MASPAGSDPRWNINIYYHRVVLDAIPSAAANALDVGCGDGLLSFDLADRGLQVTGIDPHEPSIQRARADRRATEATCFVMTDLFTSSFEAGSFDMVVSIAMLHHVDAEAGIRRMRELVRPGGVLAIVGFAAPSTVGDHIRAAAGRLLKESVKLLGRYWEHHAPVTWPPPLSAKDMATMIQRELPGATFRNVLSNRFTAVWTRPT